MQPANVIAYAIAGTMDIDLEKDPLGADAEGNPVFYADIVPAADEVAALDVYKRQGLSDAPKRRTENSVVGELSAGGEAAGRPAVDRAEVRMLA